MKKIKDNEKDKKVQKEKIEEAKKRILNIKKKTKRRKVIEEIIIEEMMIFKIVKRWIKKSLKNNQLN